MTLIYFAVRHKATGLLMPQGKRNRGYSHWNPAVHTISHCAGMDQALPIPRLIDTIQKANRCIIQWAINPNAKHRYDHTSYSGEDIYSTDIKKDGRTKNDLEVVEVRLKMKGPNDPYWSEG